MKTMCLVLLRAYQALLGPFLGGNCRFYPSCSHYAYEAIERFGARRGSWLAVRRLLRCHPFSAGGVDPVPHEDAGPASGRSAGVPRHSNEEEFAQ